MHNLFGLVVISNCASAENPNAGPISPILNKRVYALGEVSLEIYLGAFSLLKWEPMATQIKRFLKKKVQGNATWSISRHVTSKERTSEN